MVHTTPPKVFLTTTSWLFIEYIDSVLQFPCWSILLREVCQQPLRHGDLGRGDAHWTRVMIAVRGAAWSAITAYQFGELSLAMVVWQPNCAGRGLERFQ